MFISILFLGMRYVKHAYIRSESPKKFPKENDSIMFSSFSGTFSIFVRRLRISFQIYDIVEQEQPKFKHFHVSCCYYKTC